VPRPSLAHSERLPEANLAEGRVGYACLHETVRCRGRSTPYYVLCLLDETFYFSRRSVPLYDARNKRVTGCFDIPHGAVVRVRYKVELGRRWMTAVQVVTLPMTDQSSGFEPVNAEDAFTFSG
jgi:hypothetical protein